MSAVLEATRVYAPGAWDLSQLIAQQTEEALACRLQELDEAVASRRSAGLGQPGSGAEEGGAEGLPGRTRHARQGRGA